MQDAVFARITFFWLPSTARDLTRLSCTVNSLKRTPYSLLQLAMIARPSEPPAL
jgi:hypothetical protein